MTIQVGLKMQVRMWFVAIEIEQLGMDTVHFHGDLINLLGIFSGFVEYFGTLVDVQRSIGAVLLKIGLCHCYICLRQHLTLCTRHADEELTKSVDKLTPFLKDSAPCRHFEEYLLSLIATQFKRNERCLKCPNGFSFVFCTVPK